MKKFPLIIAIMLLLALTGCDKDDLSKTLSDTLYVQNDGASMPAYIHGNGQEKTFVIILHGGPGGNGLEYRAGSYATQLESKYAMVYWDQRGQGMSQGQYADATVTVDQMAEDTYALISVLKAKYGADIKVFLMGHSWGGTLGTRVVLNSTYRAELKGWIEADGAHDIPLLNKEAIKMFLQVGSEQIAAGNSVDKWQGIITWAQGFDTTNITIDQSGEINSKAHEVEQILQEDGVLANSSSGGGKLYSPVNALTSLLSGNATADLLNEEVEQTAMTDQMHQIDIPCLFLWGRYDFVVPPALGSSGYNAITHSNKHLVFFEKSAHSPMDNEPDAFVAAVVNFVEMYR